MNTADWLSGFGLALFLALPFGMVTSLVMLVTGSPREYELSAPIVTPTDIRRCLIAAAVSVVILTPLMASLSRADRSDVEQWQSYIRDHKCVAVDSRTRTEYQFNPATKINQSTTVTEYLWRCEAGDEYWRR